MTVTDTVSWATEHGKKFVWTAALDNYEPPRRYGTGAGYLYDLAERGPGKGVILTGLRPLRDAAKAVFVLDDGATVAAYYVAGYKLDGPEPHLILHPFPTNFNTDGTPRVRPGGQTVDYTNWTLGPRRLYHLKVRVGTPVSDFLNRDDR